MKRFVSTKFFLALQEDSKNGIKADVGILEKEYEEFATLMFSGGGSASTDRTAQYNALVYARIELSTMTIGKKNG